MKRILYFDASAGVSGDMFVGALLDLGADLDEVRRHVAALGVGGFELQARKVNRRGLMGTKFDVLDPGTGRPVDEPAASAEGGTHGYVHGHHHHGAHDHHHEHHHQGHGQDHGHGDETDHGRERPHVHSHGNVPGPGRKRHDRGLREIRRLIRGAALPGRVAADAVAVFELLAAAEAKVHGTDPETVHFHEVGALDSIADIVAAATAFQQLAVDEAWCSPIHVGSGTVRCAHGLLPVPAPATLELLRGVPIYSEGIAGELATPTGAALVRHFCSGFCPMPPVVVEAVGYGAGTKDFGIPGLLRATLGTAPDTTVPRQTANVG
jgi:uncharacterized protein (DUF111 family)